MRFWVTTDTHMDHDAIVSFAKRPEDYQERIIKGLSVLRWDDVLIHLGDVAFSDAGERKYLRNIPCKKWLVHGNHDKTYTYHLNEGWDWVGENMQLARFGELIKFSHMPVPLGEETIQFHGHFHNAPERYWEGWLKAYITSKHHLLIIEDMDYQPVTLKALVRKAQRERAST